MTEKDILEEVVSLISEQPTEFLNTLKVENGEWKSKEEIKKAAHDAYSERLKKVVDQQKGRAVRERMSETEKFLKENWGVESGESLEARIKTLVETIEAKGGKEKIVEKHVELTDESAKSNPIVQKLLKAEVQSRLLEAEKERDDWKKKYSEYIESEQRSKLDTSLFSEASNVFGAIKAALHKDPEKRERQVKTFVLGLKSQYSFKLDANGKPYPVNGAGEPLEDPKTFATISLAELIKRENIFDVNNFDPDKDSPSPSNQQPGNNRQVAPPTDTASFMKQLQAEKDPDKRRQIMEAYEAKLKG